MAGVLYQLGDFQFTLRNGAPRTLERQLAWRWPQQDRIGRKPARQYLGPDLDQITLDGLLYPNEYGKQGTIDELKALGDGGEPLTFTDGMGRVYPRMVIMNIRESREVMMDNGAARRIAFTITISEYGEDGESGSAGFLNFPAGLGGFISSLSSSISAFSPFQGAGSPFDLTSWTGGAGVSEFIGAATSAGFGASQLAGVAAAVGGGANVPGALAGFGIGGLSGLQSAAWEAAGISAQGLLDSAIQGRLPAASSIGLDALRNVGQSVINDLGGAAAAQLSSLVEQAGTIVPLLNVDPAITQSLAPTLVLD